MLGAPEKVAYNFKTLVSYFLHVELASTFKPYAALTKSGTHDVGLLFFDS